MYFFNDTAATEIYTLSQHDALPIYRRVARTELLCQLHPTQRQIGFQARKTISEQGIQVEPQGVSREEGHGPLVQRNRSEEHTSELQSRQLYRMPSSA